MINGTHYVELQTNGNICLIMPYKRTLVDDQFTVSYEILTLCPIHPTHEKAMEIDIQGVENRHWFLFALANEMIPREDKYVIAVPSYEGASVTPISREEAEDLIAAHREAYNTALDDLNG